MSSEEARVRAWTSPLLGDVASIEVGGTPGTEVQAYWGGDVPWMTSGDVHMRRISDVPGRITKEGLAGSNAKLVEPPAVAVALAGQGKTRGTVALTDYTLSCNQSVALIKGNNNALSTSYLFHELDNRYEELRARSSGGGRGGLSMAILSRLPMNLPPLSEQRRIAEVLDTADEAIQTTQRLIAKIGQAKQGLIHDLFTRGTDGSGHLRDPQRHPHQFVRSRVGLLPKEWPIVSIGQIIAPPGSFIQTGPFGSQLHANEYVAEGTPVVMPQDIEINRISASDVAHINSRKAQQLSRHRMRPGDIVFARRGDLSKCAAITPSQDGWLCGTGCLLLRPPAGLVSRWLAALYQHAICQRQIAATAVGTTMVNLNTKLVSNLQIPLPSSEEQQRISDVIASEEAEAVRAVLEVEKLRLLKQGLMDDLLTGRVRVGAAA